MILYEYHCEKCGRALDVYSSMKEKPDTITCPDCGGKALQVMAISGVNTAKEDAAWIKTVTEVVEKNSGKAHCENFLKDPTRANYEVWKRKEGVRHLEPGERVKPQHNHDAAEQRVREQVLRKFQQRNAISIGR